MYCRVAGQVRVAPMGGVIALDYGAVLRVIELYAMKNDIKKIFEGVVMCFRIERGVYKERE